MTLSNVTMGNLLLTPVTEKETHRGQTLEDEVEYAVSSMQGWRVHMEDAHICQPSLFAEERIILGPVDTSPTAGPNHGHGQKGTSSNTDGFDCSSQNKGNSESGNDGSMAMAISPSKREDCKRDGPGEDGHNVNHIHERNDTAGSGEDGNLVKKAKTDNNSQKEDKDEGKEKQCNGNDFTMDTSTDASNCNSNTASPSATPTSASSTTTTTSSQFRKIHLPNHSLFAVFDGHGGAFAAQYAGLNFVRVLSRQHSFVQYANFVQEQNAREKMEKDANHDSCHNNINNVDHKVDHNNTNTNTTSNHNEDDTIGSKSPVHQAQIHRQGLELLEQAFRDAFLDLDREIWRVVNQFENEDCIIPTKNHNNNHNNNNNNDDSDQQQQDQDNDEYSFSQEDSGTTAVAVMLTPQYIICANAGDSRAVYSKQGNCAIPLSYDHKPDDEEEERRIVEAGGFVRVGRVHGDLAVSRGLGDFRFKEYQLYNSMGATMIEDLPFLNRNGNKRSRKRGVEIHSTKHTRGGDVDVEEDVDDHGRHMEIMPDDQKVSPVPDIIVQKRDQELDEFVVIACDGIFDVQTNHECISMTAEIFEDGEEDLGLVCEEILDICLNKGSKDNMTALVMKFPAQKITAGSGVMKRREARRLQAEEMERQENALLHSK